MNRKVLAGLIALLALGVLIIAGYFALPYFKTGRISKLEKKAESLIAAGDLIDAEILIRKALDLDPENPDLHFKLAQILEKEGVLDQAREHYLLASKAGKSPDPGYLAGIMTYKLGKPEEAEKVFTENLRTWPEDIPTLYQLGWLLARKGNCLDAIGYFEKIVAIKPLEAEAYNNLGFCLYTLDQPEKAKKMLQRALEINPNLESAKKSLQTIEADLAEKTLPGATAEPCPNCK